MFNEEAIEQAEIYRAELMSDMFEILAENFVDANGDASEQELELLDTLIQALEFN